MAENDRWDSEFDVVIAGAGGAGLAAAIEAAEAGARTVVFEKQGRRQLSSEAHLLEGYVGVCTPRWSLPHRR